jgi:A118 family predicted phage portal protein
MNSNVNVIQQDVIDFLKKEGHEIDEDSYKKIKLYFEWFSGKVKEFHEYRHFNGITYSTKHKFSLGLPKKFCEAWADLLFNEKVWIQVEDKDQKNVDKLLNNNNFRKQMNQLIEKTFALGTGATIEYKNFLQKPKIKYVIAPMIFPLRSEDGEVVDCAFASYKGKGEYYVEIHLQQPDESYKILNRFFTINSEKKIIKTPIQVIKEVMKPQTTSREKLFQILTPNLVNNIDIFSKYGLSIYANAIDEIKTADEIFDSFKNEYVLGKKRVYVKAGAINVKINADGETVPIFDENQLEFFAIPGEDEDGKDLITESQSDLRAEPLINGLDTAINLAADKCGFGPDYFSFKDGEVYTNTTQVISSNSKLYRTLRKHELILEQVLIGVVKGLMYLSTGKIYDKDITIDFDDSIIEDKAEIRRQAQLEFNMGLIDAIQYYQDVYKMSEEQAIEYYNKIQARKPKVEEELPPEE